MIPLIIGAAIMAAGKIKGGNAAKAQGEYNAAIDERNAAVARDQANAKALQQHRVSRKVLGSMRAAYGASGVTVEGSPLDVLESSAGQAELDRLTILYEGELKAIGAESSAALRRTMADEAQTSGYFDAAGSLMSAFGSKGMPTSFGGN